MIEAENLTKKFDDFTAVDSVSLSVPAGQVLALLGPNGAGKTTTVRMLSAILKPTSGRAVIAGYDVTNSPAEIRRSIQDGVADIRHAGRARIQFRGYRCAADLHGHLAAA